jgi:hypothetical protein
MILKSAIKNGISPALIASQLLSNDDKDDMLNGLLTQDLLDLHVKLFFEKAPNLRFGAR